MESGYFFVGDFLGFGNVVRNSKPGELQGRIDDWVGMVGKAAKASGITRYQLLSDTVFAAAGKEAKDLGRLIRFAQYLLTDGLSSSSPVRGAVTFGPYEWGNIIYGGAVVDAHQLEAEQDWIGVGCHPVLPHVDDFWGLDKLVCFPVPMKRGPIQLRPAVAWDVPPYSELSRLAIGRGLTSEGTRLDWDWATKITNTLMFRLYRRAITDVELLKQRSKSGRHFMGNLPIELVEAGYQPPAVKSASTAPDVK
jgi:hypothetical protein